MVSQTTSSNSLGPWLSVTWHETSLKIGFYVSLKVCLEMYDYFESIFIIGVS